MGKAFSEGDGTEEDHLAMQLSILESLDGECYC